VTVSDALAPTRRARLRAQTTDEIKAAARAQLAAGGPEGVQLRAVAREVGLTAPALYRYFPSREDLVDDLTVDLFDELVTAMEAARDAQPEGAIGARLCATSYAFREYAVAHPSEFRLMFATPPGALGQAQPDRCAEASSRFGNVFAEQFLAVWQRKPFPVPADDELVPGLVQELEPYYTWLNESFGAMPRGAVVRFVLAWVRLYGLVSMEVFGQLGWALGDASPLLEQLLQDIGAEWELEDTDIPVVKA
jgi:AcrR family transcriptional regulator